MARQIIIQERIHEPSDFSFKFVCWIPVPTGSESIFADQLKTSVVEDATTDELNAIKNGQIVEYQDVAIFPTYKITQDARKNGDYPDGHDKPQYLGSDIEQIKVETTIDDIKAYAASKFAGFQADVISKCDVTHDGTYFNGTDWVGGQK